MYSINPSQYKAVRGHRRGNFLKKTTTAATELWSSTLSDLSMVQSKRYICIILNAREKYSICTACYNHFLEQFLEQCVHGSFYSFLQFFNKVFSSESNSARQCVRVEGPTQPAFLCTYSSILFRRRFLRKG